MYVGWLPFFLPCNSLASCNAQRSLCESPVGDAACHQVRYETSSLPRHACGAAVDMCVTPVGDAACHQVGEPGAVIMGFWTVSFLLLSSCMAVTAI